jgi:carbamate kinase
MAGRNEVVLTHENGAQVGAVLIQNELGKGR